MTYGVAKFILNIANKCRESEMRKGVLIFSFVSLGFLMVLGLPRYFDLKGGTKMTEEIKNLFGYVLGDKEIAFQYLGYSGVILKTSEGAIIIDPADRLRTEEMKSLTPGSVNLILFTHNHYDHFNHGSTVSLFRATGAPLLAEPAVAADLRNAIPKNKLSVASVEELYKKDNISIKAIKGTHVGPILLYHISIGKITIFHGGDSDYVPLQGLKAEVAFLPAGEPSPTASPQAAFRMASELEPKVVVAIHGSQRQNKELENLIHQKWPDLKVIIPAPYSINRVKLD